MGTIRGLQQANLKNEDPPGTEIQLCTPATIRHYSAAVKRAPALIFSPALALGFLRNITEPYF